MKQTKGQWTQDGDKIGTGERYIGGFKTVICEANMNLGEESHANAKLIAAAPDLLNALKKMKSSVEYFNQHNTIHAPAYFDACEAIKKATT